MHSLNFPLYNFRLKNRENKVTVFDELRKKFVVLTPEEWVRQHVVHFLLKEKNFPKSLLNVEKQLKVHGLLKRYDVIAYNPDGSIHLVVECKAASVPVGQETFDQIARYNLALNSTFLMVTNGLQHYFCKMNYTEEKYDFLPDLPEWQ